MSGTKSVCRTCGQENVSRWSWLVEVKWMLHTRQSPTCLQGRYLRTWFVAWLKLRLFGVSAPPKRSVVSKRGQS